MARRFLDEEQNKLRKRNNAASSIARNITATAKQVKTQQKPVQRRTMNISKATVSAPKTQTKVQKSTQITQPKKQRNYNQNTWSPVTDPVKEYFSPVPDRPKVVDPAQQRRRNITLNAINEVEQTPAQYRTPNNQNISLPNAGDFLRQSGQNIEAGVTRNLSDQAFGWGDFALRNQQEYNAEREAWMKAVNEDESIRNNVLTQQLMNTSNQLADNPMANTTWGQLMQNFGYNMGPGGLAGAAGTVIDNMNVLKAFNLVPMAVASYGSGLREKLNEGYEDKYARRYGLANAFNETLFQESIDPSGTVLGATPMTIQSLGGEAVQEGAGQLVDPLMDLTLRDYENWGDFWNALQGAGREMISPENLVASAEAAKMGALGALVNVGMTNPAGAYQQAREDISNIVNRNQDDYADAVNDLKAQMSVLDGVNTREAELERRNYQARIESIRDYFLQPGALQSSNVVVRNAAQSANRDRIMDDATRFGMNSVAAGDLATIANRIGTQARVDPYVPAEYNGWYLNGELHVSPFAENPAQTAFAHEVTHSVAKSRFFNDFKNVLYRAVDSGALKLSRWNSVQELRNELAQPGNYDTASREELEEEVVAHIAQEMFGNEAAIADLARNNRSFAAKTMSYIQDAFSKIGATAEERQAINSRQSLERVRDLFQKAIDDSNIEATYTPELGFVFSRKLTDRELWQKAPNAFDANGNLRDIETQLDDFLQYPSNNPQRANHTYAIADIGDGLNFANIYGDKMFISEYRQGHAYAHVSKSDLANMIRSLKTDAALGVDYTDQNGKPRKNIFIEYKGQPYQISVGQSRENGADLDAVITAFNRGSNFEDYLEDSINFGNKVYPNDKTDAFISKFAPNLPNRANAVSGNGRRLSKKLRLSKDEARVAAMMPYEIEESDLRSDGSVKSLNATHNTTIGNAERFLGIGGAPMMSVAVAGPEGNRYRSGDDQRDVITFLFDKDRVDPSNPDINLHRTDGWTPVFPPMRVGYNDRARFEQVKNALGKIPGWENAANLDDDTKSLFNNPEEILDRLDAGETPSSIFGDSRGMQALYLLSRKKSGALSQSEAEELREYMKNPYDMESDLLDDFAYDTQRIQKYKNWLDKAFGADMLWDAHNSKTVPYSAENALEIMKARRDTSDWPVVLNALGDTSEVLLPLYWGKFNNLDEAIAERKSLGMEDQEKYEKLREDLNEVGQMLVEDLEDFNELADDEELLQATRDTADAIEEWAAGSDHSVDKLLDTIAEKGFDVSTEAATELVKQLENSKTFKRHYFEAKAKDVTRPSDIRQAYVPKATGQISDMLRDSRLNNIARELENRGIEVIRHDSDADVNSPDALQNMINLHSRPYKFSKKLKSQIDKGDVSGARATVTQAVDSAYQEGLSDAVKNDPKVQKLIRDDAEKLAKDLNLTSSRTAEQIAKGNGSGQFRSASNETKEQIQAAIDEQDLSATRIKETGIRKRLFDSVETTFNRMGMDSFYEELMKNRISEENKPIGMFKKNSSLRADQMYMHGAMADYLLSKIEVERSQIERELNSKHWSSSSQRLTEEYTIWGQDGKPVQTEEANKIKERLDKLGRMKKDALAEKFSLAKLHGTGENLLKAFNEMTPWGQMDQFKKLIGELNKELQDRYKFYPKAFNPFKTGKLQTIKVTADFEQEFYEAKNQRERTALIKKFLEEAGKQYPHTLGEQIDSWRYLSMLGNPTTLGRNTVGNYGMKVLTDTRNITAHLIEKGGLATGLIRDYKLDFNSQEDMELFDVVDNAVIDRAKNAITRNNKAKDITARRQALEQEGFEGRIAKDLANYLGDELDLGVYGEKLDETAMQMASNLKEQGIDLDKFNKMTDADLNREINKAYNQVAKSLMDSTHLRHTTVDGKLARAKTEDYPLIMQAWNEVKGDSSANQRFRDRITNRGMKNWFYDSMNEKAFNENWPGMLRNLQKAANWSEKKLSWLMNDAEAFNGLVSIGDQSFARKRFLRTFSEVAVSQGLTMKADKNGNLRFYKDGKVMSEEESNKVKSEITEYAYTESLIATFRQFNALADLLMKTRNIPVINQVMKSASPFIQTPLNIAMTAFEYSPVGLLKTVTLDLARLNTGEMSPEGFINDLSKNFTGTGMAIMGWFLAQMGILRGGRDDEDDKEKKYRGKLGEQNWAINIPDSLGGGTYSISFLAPSDSGLLMGAQAYEMMQNRGAGDSGVELAGKLLSPIIDNTYLQTVQELLEVASGESYKGPVQTLVESYAGQLTPTLGGKLRRAFDDTARSTYSDNMFDRILRTARSKSFLIEAGTAAYQMMVDGEYTPLEPQLDVKGNEVKNVGGNWLGRAAYQLLSLGTYKPDTEDQYDTELLRLYDTSDASGKEALLPYQFYSLGSKRAGIPTESLSPEEVTDLNKYYLQGLRDSVQEYMDSGLYAQHTDEERVETLKQMQTYYLDKTRERFFSPTATPEQAKKLLSDDELAIDNLTDKLGMSPYQAMGISRLKADKDSRGENVTNSRAMHAREYLEALGIGMNQVKKLAADGDVTLSSLGLNDTVTNWGWKEYRNNMNLLEQGLYAPVDRVAKKTGLTSDQVYANNHIESRKDSNGETIKNSRAMLVRENLINLGVYDDVVRMIEAGELDYSDVNLNKTVVSWDNATFKNYMKQLDDGSFDGGKYMKRSGGSSSGRSASRRSGSGRSTSDINKMYQKLYDMAMDGTLDSIGDIAASMSKSAKTTVKDLVDDGESNHSALIRELEKMIAAQK